MKIRFNKIIASLAIACQLSTVQFASANSQSPHNLPNLGTVAASSLTIEKEKLIGNVIRKQLRATSPVISDPLLDEYINTLGKKLVSKANDVRYPFDFYLIRNPQINAFATFGGVVAIHTQTLLEAETESELVSVLSHEIAHVTQRHIARSIEEQQRNAPLTIASLLGAILIAMADPSAGAAAITTAQASSQQMTLNYTRQNEKEADRIGLRTLIDAGYDPRGARDFFVRLAEQTRYSSKLPAMLYSHPLPDTRVSDIRARIDGLAPVFLPVSSDFQLAKIRTAVFYTQRPEYHIEFFENRLKNVSPQHKPFFQYGLALALMKNEEYLAANKIIDELLDRDSSNLFYLDLKTDIVIGLKQFKVIYELLEQKLKLMPNNQVLVLNYANALVQGDQANKAVDILKDFIILHPQHYLAWQIMADAYKQLGNRSQYHQAQAELYALVLAYPKAIDELHTAFNHIDRQSEIDKKRISARIKQLRNEQENLKRL
ncbi:M48 family metalloprotease [Catenovulum sp. 2E275]|uniref:beta-barrel assembly-enhancing protease n=1 Tax=Catenovulum sp. 2E275 TaxID=2980497 RepID=UPI0021D3EC0A|nr:M48 family metalloprotease [Catenovulum sp. 2E275]MCU4676967.1 M48 family metalloprotease [Catenovulum sp. 2E275]